MTRLMKMHCCVVLSVFSAARDSMLAGKIVERLVPLESEMSIV